MVKERESNIKEREKVPYKWAVHKRRGLSSEGEGFGIANVCGQWGRGSSDAMSEVFIAKNIKSFKNYGVFVRTKRRRLEVMRTFCRQEGEVIFLAILWRRLLWTAPNSN